jgi:hypothetical protein
MFASAGSMIDFISTSATRHGAQWTALDAAADARDFVRLLEVASTKAERREFA